MSLEFVYGTRACCRCMSAVRLWPSLRGRWPESRRRRFGTVPPVVYGLQPYACGPVRYCTARFRASLVRATREQELLEIAYICS